MFHELQTVYGSREEYVAKVWNSRKNEKWWEYDVRNVDKKQRLL